MQRACNMSWGLYRTVIKNCSLQPLPAICASAKHTAPSTDLIYVGAFEGEYRTQHTCIPAKEKNETTLGVQG